MYDVLIIGAGVVGCAIARELSRFQLKTAVVEKGSDVAVGTSKANSAIVHAGYDAKPGTMKAKMNIAGNPMFDHLSRELDFPFRRNGSLVLCFDQQSFPLLEKLLERGIANGVPGLRIVMREELLSMEPGVGPSALAALYAPTGGIVCPYEMTIALAENAVSNGVEFYLNQPVVKLEQSAEGFLAHTPNGLFQSKLIVNAAGIYADDIHNMLSGDALHIVPRSGQYCLMDKSVGRRLNHTLFQLPTKMGKGILVTPTVDGNLLLGPTAVDLDDKENLETRQEDYKSIIEAAALSIGEVPTREIITAFSGLRAHCTKDDFIIGEADDVPGFYDVAGIESPGLTSAPAIGAYVAGLLEERLSPRPNPLFRPERKGLPKFREMNAEERQEQIKKNPLYGKIICRCEMVTEGEIIDAIHRPLGARDLDGLKRRTRAGMGRCQAGFCTPQLVPLLSRELGIPLTAVTKSGGGSYLLAGKNKELEDTSK